MWRTIKARAWLNNLGKRPFHSKTGIVTSNYKTGIVTSNFGRFIHTATRHYRTRNFHLANFDLLSRHNQEYHCNSYFPRIVKLWNSLPNIPWSLTRISCGLESIFTNTLEVYYKLTFCHDLSIIFHTFFFNLLCNYLILLCKSYTFFLSLGDTLQLGLRPVRLSGHVILLLW